MPPKKSLPTWAPPRRAKQPKVIPLIFTNIQRSTRAVPLAIHQELADTPRFHPYRARSIPPPINTKARAPDPSENPPSPLTPSPEDEDDAIGSPMHPATTPGPSSIMYTSCPSGFTLTNSGWEKELVRDLRNTAKSAVLTHLELGKPLSAQDEQALQAARNIIFEQFPAFKNHLDFWGANAALREQLKNLKDTDARKKRKATTNHIA
ncbi:hypothetical protein BT96DRAFT_933135 [Gymnopus androsaceus JB14]|uniref:Uncharacterized protein n=1 Tax=Gymnopus androsaceus JB14 TaxID=1447944 RepID=A0A6A4ICH7_9AGAR|nr:hypothetical protein BT96DRAFT_933135 [Gymnopus androsaceus JB14]